MAESEDMYRLAERRGVEVQRRNAEIRFLIEKAKLSNLMEKGLDTTEFWKEDRKFKRKILKTFLIPCEKCPLFKKALQKHKRQHYKESHQEYFKEILKYERSRVKLSPSS